MDEKQNINNRPDSLRGLSSRVDSVERQVQSMQSNVTSMQDEIASMDRSVAENSRLIKDVKSDTEEIVTIVKGLKIFGRVLAWAAGIVAAWFALKGGVPW